jgi:hypothetical protein
MSACKPMHCKFSNAKLNAVLWNFGFHTLCAYNRPPCKCKSAITSNCSQLCTGFPTLNLTTALHWALRSMSIGWSWQFDPSWHTPHTSYSDTHHEFEFPAHIPYKYLYPSFAPSSTLPQLTFCIPFTTPHPHIQSHHHRPMLSNLSAC